MNTSDVPATVDEVIDLHHRLMAQVEERLARHRKAAHLWEIKRQALFSSFLIKILQNSSNLMTIKGL